MSGSLTTFIPLILIGLVLLVVAVWMMMRLGQSTSVMGDESLKKDVLDEGAAPAQRNQALIDAAPAASKATLPPVVEDNPPPLTTPTPTPAPVPPLSTEPVPKAAGQQDPVEDTPAPLATSTTQTARGPSPDGSKADDLRQIKGIGPKLVTILAEEGVTTFAQIAAWTDSDIAKVDEKLGRFSGRIVRDQWVEQAKLLISDNKEAFAEKFGNNG